MQCSAPSVLPRPSSCRRRGHRSPVALAATGPRRRRRVPPAGSGPDPRHPHGHQRPGTVRREADQQHRCELQRGHPRPGSACPPRWVGVDRDVLAVVANVTVVELDRGGVSLDLADRVERRARRRSSTSAAVEAVPNLAVIGVGTGGLLDDHHRHAEHQRNGPRRDRRVRLDLEDRLPGHRRHRAPGSCRSARHACSTHARHPFLPDGRVADRWAPWSS